MLNTTLSQHEAADLPFAFYPSSVAIERDGIFRLDESDLEEAIQYLNAAPIHSVILHGFLSDNGLHQRLNRGEFFGYRNGNGTLEGVALIGHSTIFDARTDRALRSFAHEARNSTVPINLVMSSGDLSEMFFREYSGGLYEPRKTCVEYAFQTRFPFVVQESSRKVRRAVPDDLEVVARAHAEMTFIESGINPLALDSEGFCSRVLRRIDKGRTFVVTENGRLIFKTDLIASTSEAAYIEGVYVAPEERGKGTGSACLSMICKELLTLSSAVCLLSNSEMAHAHRCFVRAGLIRSGECVSLFL